MVKSYRIDTSAQLPVYSVSWEGDSESGSQVASGIYFSKLKAGKFTSTKKMILMK